MQDGSEDRYNSPVSVVLDKQPDRMPNLDDVADEKITFDVDGDRLAVLINTPVKVDSAVRIDGSNPTSAVRRPLLRGQCRQTVLARNPTCSHPTHTVTDSGISGTSAGPAGRATAVRTLVCKSPPSKS